MKLALEFTLSPFELAFLAACIALILLAPLALGRPKPSVGSSVGCKPKKRARVSRSPTVRLAQPPRHVHICARHAQAYRASPSAGVAG